MTDSNIGETGPQSIRLNGTRVENLPLGESARAVSQMPLVHATERLNKIAAIKARYPAATTEYLQSRIEEAAENIERTTKLKQDLAAQINEYTGHVSLCRYRDDEIARAADIPDEVQRDIFIKDVKRRFPQYSVEAMELQIKQSREGIERADDVIAQEYKSIAELSGVLRQCAQRDAELRALGA